ncbi:SDR family NAD(P)-dependent oxidoreductase [Granulosicoccus antarcticus]|uniref:Gluconate 5-dehydrogenase n=1 Tax=Granulosicoccus antarcticus IMCC3135 TaxID=1192854 RepID=A0A2Z2P141_9GAMM|nr:SDR family oxidoreductase [Granulosicoccus antarcticus]ASJ74037.1 Gluconate 5-dehydrogenase [Granulosicoccus antarcticus IMCC3135]
MSDASPDSLFKLSGKTALVTGGSRGIGRSLALGLAAAGADVIATTRSEDPLTELCHSIEALGRKCHVFQLDVRDVSSVTRLFAELKNQRLSADILINNAGVEQVCPSLDVDEALWDTICDTNLKGSFFVAQQFAKALIALQKEGSLINLGSLTSAVGVPTATAYTASKSGILGMTRALSTEWSPQGIRVNAIGPGYFRTELTEAFYQDQAWQDAMRAKIPMDRFGQLDELTGIAVFLASRASSYVSGQIFYVDGGYLASI